MKLMRNPLTRVHLRVLSVCGLHPTCHSMGPYVGFKFSYISVIKNVGLDSGGDDYVVN